MVGTEAVRTIPLRQVASVELITLVNGWKVAFGVLFIAAGVALGVVGEGIVNAGTGPQSSATLLGAGVLALVGIILLATARRWYMTVADASGVRELAIRFGRAASKRVRGFAAAVSNALARLP